MKYLDQTKRNWRAAGIAGLACALIATELLGAPPQTGQSSYASPELAVAAMREAVKSGDANALRSVFGPAIGQISNPDPAQHAKNMATFAKRLSEFVGLSKREDGTLVVLLGEEHWPFPIPLTMANGQWYFDTLAGQQEILNRRLGANELSAIEVCHAYVDAQRQYMLKDYDGNGVMEYAQRMQSSPGKKDGLYWETAPGDEESPFGPLVTKATEDGYSNRSLSAARSKHDPFHGYFFRILKKQGGDAPGGKYDYVINGHMVAGFAFLAYPAEWGNTGVMTFIVNQRGKVYQKNLGEKTEELAKAIDEYNPDDTWKPAE